MLSLICLKILILSQIKSHFVKYLTNMLKVLISRCILSPTRHQAKQRVYIHSHLVPTICMYVSVRMSVWATLENTENLTRLMNSICLHTIQFDLCRIQQLSFYVEESLVAASAYHCFFKKSYVLMLVLFLFIGSRYLHIMSAWEPADTRHQ